MEANTYAYTAALADYAIAKKLIEPADRTWAVNSLLAAMRLEDYAEPEKRRSGEIGLEEILGFLTDFAAARGLIQGDITSRDLFDTGLMGILTPRPSSSRSARASVTIISWRSTAPVGTMFWRYMAEDRPDSRTSRRKPSKSPSRRAWASAAARRFSA